MLKFNSLEVWYTPFAHTIKGRNMKYKRPQLLACYCDLQAKSLQRSRNVSYGKALEFVKEYVLNNYKAMQGTILKTTSPGNTEIQNIDVLQYLESVANKIIAPSGSIYRTKDEIISTPATMIVEKMKERANYKKLQFKAANEGDIKNQRLYKHRQNAVKITCNSLPGGFGSPFNIMYDKGGYNSITSVARAMIGLSITTAEQLLGGNFSWFTEDELYNFMMVLLEHCPDAKTITSTVSKYKMKTPSHDELFVYYKKLAKLYNPRCRFLTIKQLINSLQQHEVVFLFYYCNLKNIIWHNEEVFKPFINFLFTYDNLSIDNSVTKDDLFSQEDSIIALTTVVFANEFQGRNLDQIASEPELLFKLVALCKLMDSKLSNLDDLFRTFIDIPVIAPCIHKKPNTLRNTVIISDTDSVIFTAAEWDVWWRGDEDAITHDAYQITALVIYWLHTTVRNIVRHFSVINCVADEDLGMLSMKNEFLYPIMLLYDIRKTYVGIVAAQEGHIKATPEPDIKGQTLKGSMFCEATREFTSDFITNQVLFPSMKGKLSAATLIAHVVAFENHISKSIDSGSCEFLKITSIKHEAEYKSPDTTAVIKAWRFWEMVMTKEYGEIRPPGKVQMFPIVRPSAKYLEWLKQHYPKTHRRMVKYLEIHRALPNNLITNPLLDKVPEELIPLINKQSIIFHNVQPVYSVMERIGICIGNKKDELLFSDIYTLEAS